MRYRALLTSALLLGSCTPAPENPKLLVMVAVDQLRGDLLEAYEPSLEGGFRRLQEGGMVFTGASHNHSETATAVGHATISTGVIPSRHGIVGNSWIEEGPDGTFRSVYAVEDSLSPLLGFPGSEGRSPANLRRPGLADWVIQNDSTARVVSLSTKDRAAITMASTAPGHVYWIIPSEARFATSLHYRDSYPEWVERFNRERMPVLMGDSVWENQVEEELRALARQDAFPWEGDGVHTEFPHLRAEERTEADARAQFAWAGGTPLPDRAVMELALVAMDELQLGQRGSVDYLGLSFSQTDYVGHSYGPLSQEQLDNLDRLDQVLGELMDALDERLGPDGWVMGLTADHGVLTIPEWGAQIGETTMRLGEAEAEAFAEAVRSGASSGGTEEEIQERIAAGVEALPWVADVLLPGDLAGEPADSFAVLYANARAEGRFTGPLGQYDLRLRVTEGTLFSSYARGTTHGSPYWYDRHVPFILYGPGLTPGRSDEGVYTYDLAPTLAALTGIQIPDDLDGQTVIR